MIHLKLLGIDMKFGIVVTFKRRKHTTKQFEKKKKKMKYAGMESILKLLFLLYTLRNTFFGFFEEITDKTCFLEYRSYLL